MFNSLAAAFGAVATFFGGIFGIHGQPAQMPPQPQGEIRGTTILGHDGRMGTSTENWRNGTSTPNGMMNRGPEVRGKVSAISGSTITLLGKEGFGTTTATTTFSIDATNATILKAGSGNNRPATSTLSAIKVGDTVSVMGTTTGTTVTAKMIIDGAFMMRPQRLEGNIPQQ